MGSQMTTFENDPSEISVITTRCFVILQKYQKYNRPKFYYKLFLQDLMDVDTLHHE